MAGKLLVAPVYSFELDCRLPWGDGYTITFSKRLIGHRLPGSGERIMVRVSKRDDDGYFPLEITTVEYYPDEVFYILDLIDGQHPDFRGYGDLVNALENDPTITLIST